MVLQGPQRQLVEVGADTVDQSLITAGLQRLQALRGELYRWLDRRGKALVDALRAAEAMPSLPHLSLVPVHRRGWGSVYAALAAGELDAEELVRVEGTALGSVDSLPVRLRPRWKDR